MSFKANMMRDIELLSRKNKENTNHIINAFKQIDLDISSIEVQILINNLEKNQLLRSIDEDELCSPLLPEVPDVIGFETPSDKKKSLVEKVMQLSENLANLEDHMKKLDPDFVSSVSLKER